MRARVDASSHQVYHVGVAHVNVHVLVEQHLLRLAACDVHQATLAIWRSANATRSRRHLRLS